MSERADGPIVTNNVDIRPYLDLPAAFSTGWFMCDACDNLHIVLKGEDGEAFATATLDEEMLVDMLAIHQKGRAK